MIIQSRKALVVDDDKLVGSVLEKLLAKRNIISLNAQNGSEANSIIINEGKNLSIAVIDLVLPNGISGWDVIDSIRNNPATGNLPLIIMTGAEISESETERLELKVNAIIQKKNFDIDKFCKILDGLIGRN